MKDILKEAYRLTREVSRLGFDWPEINSVLEKLEEELEEFREALLTGDRKKMGEELGDLLFVMVNIARFLRIHPEKALEKTVKKFKSRFYYVEEALQKRGKSLRQSSLAEMDELWEEAKRAKARNPKHEIRISKQIRNTQKPNAKPKNR
jgi:tetrapyrrole methylase family protein/MazG family protein